MLTYLQDMQDADKLRAFPLWKAHQLTGYRKGFWSLHVTRLLAADVPDQGQRSIGC
jgi:proteic killer suppression protein